MDLMEIFKKRKSIRTFNDKKVEDKIIDQLLEAAMLAPSAGNLQPWRFIVIRDKDKIDGITEATYQGSSSENPPQLWIKDADVLIIVCTDNRKTRHKYGEMGIFASVQDTAAAVENILLAAAALDLAGCWIGGFREDEIRPLLKLPERVEIAALIPLGYSDEDPPRRKRFAEDKLVFFEEYGNRERG